jgi:hypothetical protein
MQCNSQRVQAAAPAAGSPFKPHTHNVLHLQSSRTHTNNILHLLAVCPHFAVSFAQAPLLLIAPQPCTDNELRLLAHFVTVSAPLCCPTLQTPLLLRPVDLKQHTHNVLHTCCCLPALSSMVCAGTTFATGMLKTLF